MRAWLYVPWKRLFVDLALHLFLVSHGVVTERRTFGSIVDFATPLSLWHGTEPGRYRGTLQYWCWYSVKIWITEYQRSKDIFYSVLISHFPDVVVPEIDFQGQPK